jgi:hypothetical protein
MAKTKRDKETNELRMM